MRKVEIDLELLISVYNNLSSYPSIHEVGKRFKVSGRVIHARIEMMTPEQRLRLKKRPTGGSRPAVPVSESEEKQHFNWTPQQCIDEMLRIVNIDTSKVITRNYFRNNSQISESTWNCHFGTFLEFKRQAKVTLSRQQHKLEREIAKHVSVDQYRNINIERASYGAKYLRPSGKRFAVGMVCSDLHDRNVDLFWLRVWLDTVERVKPDWICFNGDIYDLPEFGKYTVDPRDWDVGGRIQFVHDRIFKPTRKAAPDAEIRITEGNHEARAIKHMADATPAMRGVLSDFHGMTLAGFLGLDRYEMNYVAKADLSAWTERDFKKELTKNYTIFNETVLCHHFPEGKALGLPGMNGHHHKHEVWSMYSEVYGSYEWHQNGCGHKRDASYTDGSKWNMGFNIVTADTDKHRAIFDYVSVGEYMALSGGQYYFRDEVSEPQL